MMTSCYLTINRKGAVKATKNKPTTKANEIAVRVNLDLPNTLFDRPQLQANIKIDQSQTGNAVITASVVENIEQILKAQLGANISLTVQSIDNLDSKLKAVNSMGNI